MPTPEFCPNCNSFDIRIHPETDEEYRWCECNTCLSAWSEDDGMADPEHDQGDGYDDDGQYDRPDESLHPHQGEWL